MSLSLIKMNIWDVLKGESFVELKDDNFKTVLKIGNNTIDGSMLHYSGTSFGTLHGWCTLRVRNFYNMKFEKN